MLDNEDEILNFVQRHLVPKLDDKQLKGEVFTPLNLVFDMLDALDYYYNKIHDKSIFCNPNLKWFEPASGMGNFSIGVYYYLMQGLNTKIPNKQQRKKHIIENMLYMSEINSKNIRLCRKIFNPDNRFKLNLHKGDTLQLDISKYWNIDKFDVIVGNPPFQEKVGPSKTEPKWDKFISYSLNNLKLGGFLCLVHPSGWRNVDGRYKYIQHSLLEKNLLYLEIHDEKDGNKLFGCSTRYDWYVLENNITIKNKTSIKFQDGILINNIDTKKLQFIPNGKFKELTRLVSPQNFVQRASNNRKFISRIQRQDQQFDNALPEGSTLQNVNVLYNRSMYGTDKLNMSKTKTKKFKYPCIYTINKENIPTFFYSSENLGHFGIPKFIWSNGAGSLLDLKGEYGLTQFAYAIVDTPSNLKKINRVFNSEYFRELMKMCEVGQNTINYKVIALFKKNFWEMLEQYL